MEHYPFPLDDDDDDMTPEQEQKIKQAFKKKPLSDEDVEKFCNHPLVIKQITPEALQTEQMQALQSLMYDGQPEEVAMNLKSRGDQFLQNKDLNKQYTQNARSCYEEGIDQKPDDIEIMYLLRLGVLRCNLLLGNFGRVEKETSKILQELLNKSKDYKNIDTKTMQMQAISHFELNNRLHYQAEGYYGLQNFSKAIHNCKSILKKFQEQKSSSPQSTKQEQDVKDLMKRSIQKEFKAQKIQDQIKTIQMHNKQTKIKVFQQICELQLVLGPQAQQIPLSYEASITIDEQKFLSFPILLIYPQHNTTDYISQAHQLSLLRQHLVQVLKQRPTWDDKDKKYNINTIEVYFQLDGVKPYKKFQKLHENRLKELKTTELQRKYRKVNIKETMIELLQSPGLVISQYPIFYIISSIGKYREQFISEER